MFSIILSNVAMMLVYMLVGFFVAKSGFAKAEHTKSMSGILIYVLGPAMIIHAFLRTEYSLDTFIRISAFFLLTLVLQALFMLILYAIFRSKYEDARYRIMCAGGTLGNIGFFGLPVICAIFPNEPIVACYSSINVMSMNLIVFTMGVFLITNDKKYVSIKGAICNPTTIAILISLPLFLFQIHLPDFLDSAISAMASMVTPMCMFILGIRLSTEKLKDVFGRAFVYLTCLLKLIIFPVFALLLVKWLPLVDDVAKVSVIVLAAAPAGAIIQSLSEIYEKEQGLAANVVLLTTILSIITMPLIVPFLVGFI